MTFKNAERLFRVRPNGRLRLKDHDPGWAGGSEFEELKNDELKALLVKVRPAFVAHLEHAKKIQSTLK